LRFYFNSFFWYFPPLPILFSRTPQPVRRVPPAVRVPQVGNHWYTPSPERFTFYLFEPRFSRIYQVTFIRKIPKREPHARACSKLCSRNGINSSRNTFSPWHCNILPNWRRTNDATLKWRTDASRLRLCPAFDCEGSSVYALGYSVSATSAVQTAFIENAPSFLPCSTSYDIPSNSLQFLSSPYRWNSSAGITSRTLACCTEHNIHNRCDYTGFAAWFIWIKNM
jgi:hypothetical protein